MNRLLLFLIVVSLLFGVTGITNAALLDRGGGLIYDDILDITWMQDVGYASATLNDSRRDAIISAVGSVNGHTLSAEDFQKDEGAYTGKMTWWGALAWTDQLEYGGFADWRLPDARNVLTDDSGPDYGYNVLFSEMGFMYHINLNGTVFGGTFDRSFFDNLLAANYWYETPYDATEAWIFSFFHGLQRHDNMDSISTQFAWAVRDGDIGAVPIPSAVWLLFSGLIGFIGIRKKFKKI